MQVLELMLRLSHFNLQIEKWMLHELDIDIFLHIAVSVKAHPVEIYSMSTPRCIRLAIRACKPTKISNPAARCQRRSLATTQRCRADRKIDIRAGFPTVPPSADDGHPQPAHQDNPDAPSKRTPIPTTTAEPPKAPAKEEGRTQAKEKGRVETQQQSQSQSSPPQQPERRKQKHRKTQLETPETEITTTSQPELAEEKPRLPLNVVAAYHKPLRHDPTHGVRVASLQLRSYSVRNLEFMCDFALRAAYFLGLPASGPVPLPKKIERWTMPRSNFAHKKSQENFERITRRRAIQIMDGHKDVVQIWLAYLRRHQFYGVGMKADVWEFESMDVAATMDAQFQELEKELDEKLSMFGWNKQVAGDKSLTEQLRTMGPGQQTGVSMMHIREGSRSESRL